jgi:hypothetical protein
MGGIFNVKRGIRKVFNYLVHFINPGVDGKIILKWVLWKQYVKAKQVTTWEFGSTCDSGYRRSPVRSNRKRLDKYLRGLSSFKNLFVLCVTH